MIKRSVLLVIVFAAIGTAGITAFAVVPAPFPFPIIPTTTSNFDTDLTVLSRVSFDPASAVTFTGGSNTTAQITSDLTRLNFAANDFNTVTISGIKILNRGSTNTIASLHVSAPNDFLVDAKSPPSSSDNLRKLGPRDFAVPITGAVGSTPGVSEVELQLMFWNSTSFVSTNKKFEPEFWSLMLGNLGNLVVNFKDAHAVASLTVHKFFDEDKDGIQDSTELNLSGWTINVYDSTGTTLIQTGTTDASGNAVFSLTEPATYKVREVFPSAPAGCEGGQWVQTLPGSPNFEYTVALTSAGATVNFGNALNCLTNIFKFFDEDGDGVNDLGEGGLQGWKMQIYNEAGTLLIAEQFTDSTGTATFTLDPGKFYIAREVIPTETSCTNIGEWVQTFPGPPDYEHKFFLPVDGGASLKFGNSQNCIVGVYVIELTISSLD